MILRMAALYLRMASAQSPRSAAADAWFCASSNAFQSRTRLPRSLFDCSRSLFDISASVATTRPFGEHFAFRYGPLPYGPPSDWIGGHAVLGDDRPMNPAATKATKPTAETIAPGQ